MIMIFSLNTSKIVMRIILIMPLHARRVQQIRDTLVQLPCSHYYMTAMPPRVAQYIMRTERATVHIYIYMQLDSLSCHLPHG